MTSRGPIKTKRGAVRVIIVLAAAVTAVALFAGWAFITGMTGGAGNAAPQPAQRSSSVDTDAACANTAGKWMTVFLDRQLAPAPWAKSMAAYTSPEVVQGLHGVDRAGLPDAHVTAVDTTMQGATCYATVSLSDRLTVPVRVDRDTSSGRWLVTGWGQ